MNLPKATQLLNITLSAETNLSVPKAVLFPLGFSFSLKQAQSPSQKHCVNTTSGLLKWLKSLSIFLFTILAGPNRLEGKWFGFFGLELGFIKLI